MASFIPPYLKNSEPPIICYKYNKPIRNSINMFLKSMLILLSHEIVNILKIKYSAAGYVVTGTLKIISDSRFRKIVSKDSSVSYMVF